MKNFRDQSLPVTQPIDASMQDSLSYGLHGLVWLMDDIANHLLRAEYDITFAKFYVMAVLSSCQPTTQANLAEFLGQSTAAVSKSLAVLEHDGYVTIETNPEHKRQNLVVLTEKGVHLTINASQALEALLYEYIGDTDVDLVRYVHDTIALRNALEAKILQENNA